MNNFLDFYNQNKISPVSQDIQDYEMHCLRRKGLYRQIGLPDILFKDRDVLEVAPGSGHNSIVTASFKTRSYDLIEPNIVGFNDLKKLFVLHNLERADINIKNTTLENCTDNKQYDIVICEGLVPGLNEHDAFLDVLKTKVVVGGILVLTCADSVSVFFETLRKYLAVCILIDQKNTIDTADFDSKNKILSKVFEPHLRTLTGMSRSVKDWVSDNLLNPASYSLAGRHEFSIEKCLNYLGNEFFFYGSSPVFMDYWGWYKNLKNDPAEYNSYIIRSYTDNIHNFLNSKELGVSSTEANTRIKDICKTFSNAVENKFEDFNKNIKSDNTDIEEMIRLVLVMNRILDSIGLKASARALEEYAALFSRNNSPDIAEVQSMKYFSTVFGRGQQYVSLVKSDNNVG